MSLNALRTARAKPAGPDRTASAPAVTGFVTPIALDQRAAQGLQVKLEIDRLRDEARAVLSAAQITLDDETFGDVVADLVRAKQAYERAFSLLLDTGRALVRLQAHVGGGGYDALWNAGLTPIHPSTASKLRKIAGFVDDGILPLEMRDHMPPTLSGAYLLACLPPDDVPRVMTHLTSRHLLPSGSITVLRREVRRLTGPDDGRQRITAELDRLRSQRSKLDVQIAALEAQLNAGSHDEPDE